MFCVKPEIYLPVMLFFQYCDTFFVPRINYPTLSEESLRSRWDKSWQVTDAFSHYHVAKTMTCHFREPTKFSWLECNVDSSSAALPFTSQSLIIILQLDFFSKNYGRKIYLMDFVMQNHRLKVLLKIPVHFSSKWFATWHSFRASFKNRYNNRQMVNKRSLTCPPHR